MKKLLFICLCLGGFYLYSQGNIEKSSKVYSTSGNLDPFQEPVQKNLSGVSRKKHKQGYVRLLAEYDITARVILKKYYNDGKNGKIAPLDLAVGWKRMSQPSVYNKMRNTQSNRFYNYRWSNRPPIPPKEITISSANIHVIAANRAIEQKLKSIKKGQVIGLRGYLVYYREEYSNGGYWEWKSSLSRSDDGQGACELMYVEEVIL